MSASVTQVHRWTRQQYENMVTSGIFHPEERLELIDGYIIDMAPQSSFHAATVQLAENALRSAFGTAYTVRVQMPLALDDNSEPEPDIAVVVGGPRDYLQEHPSTAVLIVEVADASLVHDRGAKKALYARNGIQEYWIVNLKDGVLEVCRAPEQAAYRSQIVLHRGDSLQPAACPDHSIAVAELLP